MYHEFNYYPGNIKESHPSGTISLWKMIQAIKHPSDKIRTLLNQIHTARINGDETEKGRLKTQLPAFTPCVLVKPNGTRKYADIDHFTGLMVLDFDKLPNEEYAQEFKNDLFAEYKQIYAAWLSASGLGVRCIVSIPKVNSVEQFKALYKGIEQTEMIQYVGYDRAPQNCILPLFLSHDPDLLYRLDPVEWTQTYTKPEHIPVKQYTPPTGYHSDRVYKTMQTAIDKITDNGHPQLRGASFALGGYVGSGYIAEHEAIQLMDGLIESNSYLNQKPAVYKQTARDMIRQGQSKPLYFN